MRILTSAAMAAAVAACASPGPPPGGPPDAEPPVLVTTVPTASATGVRPARVIFRFDEVVNEQPRGAARTLGDLFIISPRDGDLDVDWRRSELRVRPRRGWRPNTVYTVTMRPGLADLRGNVRREGAELVFSTGGEIPDTRLDGIIFDWAAGRVIPNAWVEAAAVEDSVVYVTAGDSAGRFSFRHLPPDVYVVTGYPDPARRRVLDPRGPYGQDKITVQDSARVELLAFVHDTIGPRIDAVTVRDSVTLRVRFDQPIALEHPIGATDFVLLTADSTAVPIAEALGARDWDRREADRARRSGDTARGPGLDTVRPAPPPAAARPGLAAAQPTPRDTTPPVSPSRPPPSSEVVIRLAQPLRPNAPHRLRAREIPGLLRVRRTSERVFTSPRAAEPALPRPAAPPAGARPPTPS